MPTVAFASSKGGVGKTTSALMLAQGLLATGRTVAMVDADPNLPLKRWAALSNGAIRVSPAPFAEDFGQAYREARRLAEWVIIDTEGGSSRLRPMAVRESDAVLVPLAASPLEAVEALKVVRDVTSLRRSRPVRCACLFTRLPAAVRTRTLKSVIEMLRAERAPLLTTPLIEKDAFRHVFVDGGLIHELGIKDVSGVVAAQANVRAYVAEVLDLLARPVRVAQAATA